MRRNIPPPPPRPLSERLYNLDARNNDRPPPHRSNTDDESEISDNDSILAMAKRLDASSVISDPSFIEGTQPHRHGLDPSGFGESGSTLGQGHPADMYSEYNRNQYYAQRDLDSIASNDQSEEHSIYTEDDGSRSEYTEESMERNPYRNMPPPPGVPRVGHHDDMYREGVYDSRSGYDEFYDQRGPSNGSDYRYQGGRASRMNERSRPRGRDQSPNAMNRRSSRSQSPGMNRRNSRSQSPSMRQSRGVQNGKQSRRYPNDSEPSTSRDTKRKLKLAAIPIIVLIVISIAIVIVFATRGGGDDKNTMDNQELIQISLPTSSPTFQGEYNCPAGYVGPSPTKGCLGYVQCNGLGRIEGEVLACPAKTLYDVNLNTCSWEESVDCSTIATGASDNIDTDSGTGVASSPTMKPVSTVSTASKEGEKVGPTQTFNHKLSFQGVLTLGDVSTFEKNMENYINIFFSPSRGELGEGIDTLAANDAVLNSISDAKVELTIKKFEWSGVTRLRSLQENAELVMIYDQKTEYVTSYSSIKVGTVVRYPYEERYEPFLIDYLKSTDDVFGSLTSVDFLEPGQSSSSGGQDSSQSSSPVAAPSMSPSSPSETAAPSIAIETASPSAVTVDVATAAAAVVSETTAPTGTTFMAFPEYATVQGFMWIDLNKNGLYETNEPPAAGTFANLKRCNDKWVQTTSSNVNGQYQFLAVEEGEYYVEFFRPGENYEFTIPMMGSDDKALDSDVALLSGRSQCTLIDPSFNQLINAGYVPVETPEETSTTTTALSENETHKYCAQVTTSSGNQSFNFFGCATRCSEDADCEDDFRCLLSKTCSKQDG